jgi:uncharacterized protein (DUF433 family)
MEMSKYPAKIVKTPGVCGGRPRLEGHRLDILWYASIRRVLPDTEAAHQHIRQGWPYLREDQIKCLSEHYYQATQTT